MQKANYRGKKRFPMVMESLHHCCIEYFRQTANDIGKHFSRYINGIQHLELKSHGSTLGCWLRVCTALSSRRPRLTTSENLGISEGPKP